MILSFGSVVPQLRSQTKPQDTCLMFGANNLANGGGNFFIYCTFSRAKFALRAGDVLEYEVYLNPTNPVVGGGIDFDTDKANLRDSRSDDQSGINAHADAHLEPAKGKWYHRKIKLDKLAGQETRKWSIVFEGDAGGAYAQFIDNVAIVHGDGSRDVVYDNGEAPENPSSGREGYSRQVLLKAIPRSQITDGIDLMPVLAREMQNLLLKGKLNDLRAQVEIVYKFADKVSDSHLKTHAEEAKALLLKAEASDSLDAESVQSLIHQVHESLGHEHPEMRKYTGHLVGHAHIDFQWLWEWSETVQVCKDTFGQALKFMDEFPGFKFSQSSSALYATTEENHPEIFKGIQKQVAAGNWELVGGRVCEGDEHMISHESHARHFLYGQRYFRERFNGKQAAVGWEPDTFGHTWHMPQILLLGGCKYFYFCRGGGKKDPMFWWQAPDGSKVLAFEEPATGGWYNGDVAVNRFERLLDFAGKTGAKDMLWVYGVGNHGGGPTRENINAALGFQQLSFLPGVRFSTATEFFHRLESYDMSKLPTVCGELNSTSSAGFYGTYTSHSDIKRWNRDAEAITESAEAIAAISSRYGFAYPGKEFRRNWEDITWNHHHDTLPGTSIHPSYNKSEAMYKRVIESSRKISNDALKYLATKVRTEGDGVLVFNPTGFARDGVVDLGDSNPYLFVKDVPKFGYRWYPWPRNTTASSVSISADGTVLENAQFKVVIDPKRGLVASIFDKQAKRECIASGGSGNRLEIHWEQPGGMSAWTIGKIEKVDALTDPVKLKVSESDGVRVTVAWDRKFQATMLHQSVTLAERGAPEFALATEWKELGAKGKPSPFLKVAFDVAGDAPKFISQIPFGTIERPADNTEVPALKWSALAGANGGAAILNDCKHGYSAAGNTIRLSLIRSNYDPDPRPNDRPQSARWVFLPITGPLVASTVTAAAESFNHPLLSAAASANPSGSLPSEMSFLSTAQPNVLVTGLKKAEDDNDLVARVYEIDGVASDASLKLAWKTSRNSIVNFMEDVIEGSQPGNLRPHEIRTLKIATSN
jgi:alpha-mannosidase